MSSVKQGGKSFCGLLCIGLVMVVIVVALDLVVELTFTVVTLSGSIKIIMAAAILSLVGFYVGLFYMAVAWAIAFPAIVLENKDACSGFSRAFELTSGRRLAVCCALLFLRYISVCSWLDVASYTLFVSHQRVLCATALFAGFYSFCRSLRFCRRLCI